MEQPIEREIILSYTGCDMEADKADFLQQMQAIEIRHLPYFISRPGIFEDDAYERLKDNFFFIIDSSRVILLQVESSLLPPEIVREVQTAFKTLFAI